MPSLKRFLIPCLFATLTAGLFFCAVSAAGEPENRPITLTTAEREWLNAHPTIRLAPDPDFKPIEYFDKEGRYQGAAADIIRLLEKKLGISIAVVRLKNWDEALKRFRNREVDLLGAMVRTPHREKFALFTDPLVSVPGGIFSRKDYEQPLTAKDLEGKNVAVVSNYAAHDILSNQHPGINLVVVPDVSTGLFKASLGLVDFYVENIANATFYAKETGIANLRMVGKLNFSYQWGIGIRKDWPELQSILNKGLAAISKEERDAATARWLYIEGQRWNPSPAMIFGGVAALFAVLLLFFFYGNKKLQRLVAGKTAMLQQELEELIKAETALKELTNSLEENISDRTRDLQHEIEERIKSEQAAVRSEQRFRELFDNLADPIYIADESGRIVSANSQACHELGYTIEELLLFSIPELDADERAAEKFASLFNKFPSPQQITLESTHRRKDGSVFPVEINVRLIDFDGRQAIIGSARNITERRQAEEARLKLEQQLLHAQKLESLGVLAGGIAHDFNNILTTIIGNADLALLRLNPESPAHSNLMQIEKAAVRAADLAKQMLAYSGKGKFLIEPIDLNRLVAEMGHMLEVSISKKAILRYNLAQPLPTVDVDATQIRQVIMNIVINASEAIGEKSGVISITTGCVACSNDYFRDVWHTDPLPPGLYVFLEIADTGCGIDKETLEKIFDPFFTTKFTGRGLGMAAVLGIVRGHGGSIKIYSEADKGSTFKVLLPAGKLSPALSDNDSGDGGWRGSGIALLVDDEENVRAIGAEMLRELGYEVVTAVDGRDAIEKCSEIGEIAIILLDLTMPRMDGVQCYKELKTRRPEIKVIMSSGFSEEEVHQKFAGKGLAGVIQKPYKLSELSRKLRAAANGS